MLRADVPWQKGTLYSIALVIKVQTSIRPEAQQKPNEEDNSRMHCVYVWIKENIVKLESESNDWMPVKSGLEINVRRETICNFRRGIHTPYYEPYFFPKSLSERLFVEDDCLRSL